MDSVFQFPSMDAGETGAGAWMGSSARRPNILVTEPAYFQTVLRRLGKVGRVTIGAPDRGRLRRELPLADIVVIRVETILDRQLIRSAPRLKLIASATTGVDHIDLEDARNQQIRVVHLHGTHTRPTAEHTLALLFCLARNIHLAHHHLTAGGWDRNRFIGGQIAGKTLGIVGLGRIGMTVARLLRNLGMRVLAYDPYVRSPGNSGAKIVKHLPDLVQDSDVLSIHAALTRETTHLINARLLRLARPTAFLVNTARGKILAETDLIRALCRRWIAGAAIDVFDPEPLPHRHPIRRYARRPTGSPLLLTPHLGASTREAVADAATDMAAAVESFCARHWD